jgi:hypothetical protein
MQTNIRPLAIAFFLLLSNAGLATPGKNVACQPRFRSDHNGEKYSDTIPSILKKAPWTVERFRLRAGLFVPINSTDVQVSSANRNAGTDLNLESDLGLSRVISTFMANFQWRVSRRSIINSTFYAINRSSTYTLRKDIVFDSTTYLANSSVDVFFNTAIYQIAYGYSILAKPSYEIGIMIGSHIVGFSTGINTNGSMGIAKNSDFRFTAPLPDLGIWGSYALSNRFALSLDASYLALTIDDTKGSIFSYNLQFLYKLRRRFDVSLGFAGLNFKISKTIQTVEGSFKWGYNGPSLSISYSFGKNSWIHSTTFDGR